ncbi:MAG: hypothetical protein JWO58_2507 [Chitinophagaceae bacterium]|nr:hypothetical protein [Chitinophagaceae bacterium]
MRINYFIALFLFFSLHAVHGQTWKFLDSAVLKAPVDRISADHYKNMFITDEHGNVYKYDSLGKLLITYSPPKQSRVSLIDAWRGINIFLFYENFQEYLVLDRFFGQTEPLAMDRDRVGFARIATFALDNNLWIFDDIDFSLKKFNTQFEKIDLETPLDLILDASEYEITFLREYQNQLFIADRNSGILVFDNLGNYKTKLPFPGVSWFAFLNDEIYFVQGEELIRYNLYTFKEQRSPLPVKTRLVLLYEHKAFFINQKVVKIYTY